MNTLHLVECVGRAQRQLPRPVVRTCVGGPNVAERTCSIEGCAKKHFARDLCSGHYARWRSTGEIGGALRPFAYDAGTTCKIGSCGRRAKSRGWCTMHYERWRRHGDPLWIAPPKPPVQLSTHKTCIACTVLQPVGEFDADRRASDGLFSVCKACRRARAAEWRRANPERERANTRKFRKSAAGKAAQARSYAKYQADPEARAAAVQRALAWNRAHPEVRRRLTQERRARLGNARRPGISRVLIRQRMAYFGNRCWICGGPEEHVDHVKPIAKGGAHMLCNLRPICASCNYRKSARWPFDPDLIRRAA